MVRMRRKQQAVPVREALSILGLPETSTLEDLKRAYRLKAKETHPDKGGDSAAFIKVKDAYDSLMELGARILESQLHPVQSQPVCTHTYGSSSNISVEDLRDFIRNAERGATTARERRYANVAGGATWWQL